MNSVSPIRMTAAELMNRLKAPFDPDAIEWRIGVQKTGDAGDVRGLALAYIDARTVQNRLDEVCGPLGWQSEHIVAPDGKKVTCRIGIKNPETGEWVWRSDGAGETDVEGEKGSYSDSTKRAAVQFGVGRYLYDLDSPWCRLEPLYPGANNKFKIAASEKDRLRKLLSGVKTTMAEQKEVERKSEAEVWVDSSIETIFQFEKEAELKAWEAKATAAIIRLGKVDPKLHEKLLDKIMLRYEQLGKVA